MAQSFQSFDGWFQPTEVDEHAPGAHLFVCQHGLWGSPADTSYLATYLRHQGYAVLNAAANTARCTFDGADVCGDRLAAEVVAALHQLAAAGTPATSLSFAAYSFGGLIARYAAGKLMAAGLLRAGSGSGSGSGGCIVEQQEQHPHQNGASTEAGAGAMWPTATPPGALVAAASGLRPLRAANFLTIASPHLGCWEEPASLTHQAYNSILPVTLSRTGRQLLLADHWLDPQAAAGARGSGGGSGGGGGLPLLAVMADPTCVFHAALALFDKRVLLADIRLDRTVPYCTAAISRHNPYSPQGADSSGSGISSTNARVSRSFQQSADPILGGKRAAAGRAGSSGVTCTAAARRQLPLVQEEEHVRGAAVVVGSLDGRGPAAKLMASAGIPGRAAGSTAVSDNCADDCAEADAEPADGPLAAAVSVTGGLLAGWVPPLLRCVPGWSLASGLTAALVELAAGVACPGSGSRWASGVLAGGLPGLGFLLGSSTSSRNGLAATSGNRPSCGEAKGRDTAQHVPTGAASCGCGACSDPHDALRPADCSCSADQVSRVRGAALVRSVGLAAQDHSSAGSSLGLHTGLRGSSGGGMLALPISSAYPCIVTPHAPPPSRRQRLQPTHGPPVAPAASSGIGMKGPWGAGASSARASNGASSLHKTVLTAAAGAAAGDGTAGASGSGTCGSGSDGRPAEGGAALRRAHSSPSRSGWAAAAAGAVNAGNSSGGESSGGSDWGLSAAPPAYGSDGAVPAHRPSAAAYLDWHWQPSYAAARVGALGGSGFGSGVLRGGTGADDALGGGGSGGGLLSASPRLRLGLFLALLPVLLALWGCMVAWLAGCWLHHVALLLAVRPDRGWDVRLPISAASGLPVPPKTERWEEDQEQRPHTSQSDQQPTGPAYMGHQASSEDVAHDGVGGTAAAGGMDASRAQDLAGPAVVRAVVATAVGNVLRRHGEGPQGAPHCSGSAASRGSAITAAACTTAVAAAVAAAHAPRDTAALLDNMITHLNMLKWQKVDVDTGHYAAHAAIVVRSSRRFGRSHGHIIEYALRQLRP